MYIAFGAGTVIVKLTFIFADSLPLILMSNNSGKSNLKKIVKILKIVEADRGVSNILFFDCEALLNRNKIDPILNRMVTGDQK